MPSETNTVVALVTVYRPDEGIFESLEAIQRNCPTVIVIDDGSSSDYDLMLDRIEKSVDLLVRQTANSGLAKALNVGIETAIEKYQATHVVTFDQDTQPDDDYLAEALKALDAATVAGMDVALVCAGRNNDWTLQDIEQKLGFNTAVEALQSGFVIPVTTVRRIGNFRSSLFIDCVDIEYMFRARANGMESLVADSARIAHTVGDRIAVKFRGNQVHVLGKRLEFSYHGPLRRYYITRNRLVLFKLYGRQHPAWARKHFLTETKIAFLCLLFGRDRPQQVMAFVAGVIDGARGREGKIPQGLARRLRRSEMQTK